MYQLGWPHGGVEGFIGFFPIFLREHFKYFNGVFSGFCSLSDVFSVYMCQLRRTDTGLTAGAICTYLANGSSFLIAPFLFKVSPRADGGVLSRRSLPLVRESWSAQCSGATPPNRASLSLALKNRRFTRHGRPGRSSEGPSCAFLEMGAGRARRAVAVVSPVLASRDTHRALTLSDSRVWRFRAPSELARRIAHRSHFNAKKRKRPPKSRLPDAALEKATRKSTAETTTLPPGNLFRITPNASQSIPIRMNRRPKLMAKTPPKSLSTTSGRKGVRRARIYGMSGNLAMRKALFMR